MSTPPLMPCGKPGIVPDQRARAGLTAGDRLLEHHRVQTLGGGVDGRSQARRSRTDDGDLARLDVIRDVDTDGAGEIGQARIDR